MGRYYYHRRSYRHYSHSELKRARDVHSLGGIDADVLRIFDGLDWGRKCQLLSHYGRIHGTSAAKYANAKLRDWASGAVKASGQTRQRLLDLVPKVLDESERYELLKKLYDTFRAHDSETHSITVLLGYDSEVRQRIIDLAAHLCNKPAAFQLPSYVQSRISWVCDNDSIAARKLMAAIETEESIIIAKAGQDDVARLIRSLNHADTAIQGTHTLVFPYGRINVHVRRPNLFEKVIKTFSS